MISKQRIKLFKPAESTPNRERHLVVLAKPTRCLVKFAQRINTLEYILLPCV